MLKTQLAPLQSPLGCSWPAKGRNPLKKRFAMLKMKSPSRRRRQLGAAAITVLVAGAGYGAWASNDEVRAATRTVVEAASQPATVRLAQASPRLGERRVDAPRRQGAASEDHAPKADRPLTETERTALEGARAALAEDYEYERLGTRSLSEVAVHAARLAELELAFGQKPAAAAEALRLAQADLKKTEEMYKVGAASRSDIGLATERLVRLQHALGQTPTGAFEALRGAQADIEQVQEMYKVGLASQSDIGLAAERLAKLQLDLGLRPTIRLAAAQAAEDVQYSVTVSIAEGGQIVTRPTLTILPGASAQIQSDRYRIEVTLMPAASKQLSLRTSVSRLQGGDWVLVARPTITLPQGGQSSASLTGAGGSLIEVAVRPRAARALS
jgi:hypothetical protein